MEQVAVEAPASALAVIEALEGAGFEAWCVGGFVRDSILGREAYDVDVASSAPWEEARDALAHRGMGVVETGTEHGTITALVDGGTVEVTTFRVDGPYGDGRHPDSVSFVRTVEEDLSRRDFTMNAIAWHPTRGLVDPFGGAKDIEEGVIRAVGDPIGRFEEDALRILRGVRFASQLGFAPDPRTEEAMRLLAPSVSSLSVERVFHELDATLKGPYVRTAFARFFPILLEALPELAGCDGTERERTLAALELTPPHSDLRWAALFHGVPPFAASTSNGDAVADETSMRARFARRAASRLRFPSKLARDVAVLVERCDDSPPSTLPSLRRAVRDLGARPDLFASLCRLQEACAVAGTTALSDGGSAARAALDLLAQECAENPVFSRADLAIAGTDLIEMGMPHGPAIGVALDATLEAVIDERVDNEPLALRAFVRGNFF